MDSEVMTYDRDIKDLHVEPSLFRFPGDESMDDDVYMAAMRNTYMRKLPFARMLMNHFAIPPSNQDEERIKRGLICMGWLDHMLDEAPDRHASLAAYTALVDTLAHSERPLRTPAWVRPEAISSTVLLRHSLAELPQENKDAIVRKAQRIGEISAKKAVQKDVTRYAIMLAEEGALSSDVVIECLSTAAQSAKGYNQLHTFNARAMAAATLLDAAIDLRQDHESGLTGVTPTLRNRFFLYRKAFGHLPYIIKTLGFQGMLTVVKVGVN